jgi:hypothetical protein
MCSRFRKTGSANRDVKTPDVQPFNFHAKSKAELQAETMHTISIGPWFTLRVNERVAWQWLHLLVPGVLFVGVAYAASKDIERTMELKPIRPSEEQELKDLIADISARNRQEKAVGKLLLGGNGKLP